MILLLSAKNEYEEALEVTDLTLEEYPDNLSIMSLKVRLEEKVHGSEAAILVAKGKHEVDVQGGSHIQIFVILSEMLVKWQAVCEGLNADESDHPHRPPSSSATAPGGGGGGANPYDTQANSRNAAFDTLSDKDSVSLHAHSVTASHVEKTLSEVASSLSSPFPRPGVQDPAYTQMRIWLLSAELHLNENNLFEAEQCLAEARQLAPLSYHLMFMRGLISEKKGELETAKQCYENSLGVNPSHVSSLHHLGLVYCQLGYHRLSEQALKVALRIDPTNEEVWSLLGEVKEAIARETLLARSREEEDGTVGQQQQQRFREETEKTPTDATRQSLLDEATRMFKRSAECHAIALSLQSSSPILPYSTIPLCLE
jgi:tetratricopeptide (TPR) repeat protein